MNVWQAFVLWVLLALVTTVLLPGIALLGWNLYMRLSPAGRLWNAWLNREVARLKKQDLNLPIPSRS